MAELKTKLTDAPAADFINALPDKQAPQDSWNSVKHMVETHPSAKP